MSNKSVVYKTVTYGPSSGLWASYKYIRFVKTYCYKSNLHKILGIKTKKHVE